VNVDEETARQRATRYLDTAASVMAETRDGCLDDILAAARELVGCFSNGGTLLICGNGGSAADAQHLATEFVSTLTLAHARPAMRAVALTTDSSALTAIANDFGVERMFARQVEAIGRPGDVLLAISTSGNSPNVLAAVAEAKSQGLRVVALTGATGGELAPRADVAIRVPSSETAHIQECHLAIEQLLALLAERELYPDPR
jgi:D-sedoheptulose 7-phosphate isomerase